MAWDLSPCRLPTGGGKASCPTYPQSRHLTFIIISISYFHILAHRILAASALVRMRWSKPSGHIYTREEYL
jgi:hypothetical protein